jgi:hypothetical protein
MSDKILAKTFLRYMSGYGVAESGGQSLPDGHYA